MRARAGRGEGGEIRVEWDEGPRWLATNERIRYALGGTGPEDALTNSNTIRDGTELRSGPQWPAAWGNSCSETMT